MTGLAAALALAVLSATPPAGGQPGAGTTPPPSPAAVPNLAPPAPAPTAPPSTAPPSPSPPAVPPGMAGAPGGVGAPGGAPAAAAPRREVLPIPTADETPAASDHDAVVGHVGLEARRLDPVPFPLALRAASGCPVSQTTACEVQLGALSGRYWWTRNLALNAGLALAMGGGRDGTRALDTYFGAGPVVGLSLLLANWKHLAVSASPEATFVWFKPGGGSARSTTLFDVRAAIEGELHFGFVGVPALSVGMMAGLGVRYESTPDARVWSLGVIGAGSVWGALSNLFVRYYL